MPRFTLTALLTAVLCLSASAQPTTDDVFPFREGNRWVYDNVEQHATIGLPTRSYNRGTTEWDVVGTVDTPSGTLPRLEIRRSGGEPTVCAVQVRSDDEQLAFDLLTPDGSEFCDAGVYVAPSPMGDFGWFGLRVAEFYETPLRIGGIDYTVMIGQGHWTGGQVDDAWFEAAAGIGVVRFDERQSFLGGNLHIYGSYLRYARVDGTEYGALTVADEEPPSVSELSLAVGPNPARAATRLFIGGDNAVRVTVLDVLGRTVEAREATPGTLALDTSAWAVGVYTVRAESADGVATARLTAAR